MKKLLSFLLILFISFVIFGFPKVNAKVLSQKITYQQSGFYLWNSNWNNFTSTTSGFPYTQFSSTTKVPVNNPIYLSFVLNDIPISNEYTYIYYYGYSNYSVTASSEGCVSVSNTAAPPNGNDGQVATSSLVPFAFKCPYEGNYYPVRMFGQIYSNNEITVSPLVYFFNYVYLTDESSGATTDSLIQQQIQIQQQELQKQQETNDKLDENNKLQEETNDKLGDLNDTLTDSSSDDPSSQFDSFNSKVADNGVITQLITMPVTLYRSILNSVNGSCTSYNFGSFFGHDLTMSCVQPEKIFGSTIWSVIDILFSGFFIFTMGKKMIKVFNKMSSMEEGDVLDD